MVLKFSQKTCINAPLERTSAWWVFFFFYWLMTGQNDFLFCPVIVKLQGSMDIDNRSMQ